MPIFQNFGPAHVPEVGPYARMTCREGRILLGFGVEGLGHIKSCSPPALCTYRAMINVCNPPRRKLELTYANFQKKESALLYKLAKS